MGSRGTTLLDRRISDPLIANSGAFFPRLASLVTLGSRLKLLGEPIVTKFTIPLSGSGRNFDQLPPGGGFNPCPRLPVGFHWLTFNHHSL